MNSSHGQANTVRGVERAVARKPVRAGGLSYMRIIDAGMSRTLMAMQRDMDLVARGVLPR